MVEEIQDKLAERIAKRRAENEAKRKAETVAVIPLATLAVPVVQDKQRPDATPTAAKDADTSREIGPAISAITSDANPLVSARLLAAILVDGTSRKELLQKIDKSKAWLSKRLGLLKAPKEFQRLIEAGELSESAYHDDRLNAKAGIKGRGTTLRFEHKPNVSITYEAAFAIASHLKDLAARQGAASINLDVNTKKKDITSIINLRAGELLRPQK